MTDDELITGIESIRQTMIEVATGGPRIADANVQYQQVFASVSTELARRNIDNPISYQSLWVKPPVPGKSPLK